MTTRAPPTCCFWSKVAASSWQTDRSVKLPMYPSAGIAEAWLVDVAGAAIEVHTQPTADGYAHTERFGYTWRARNC